MTTTTITAATTTTSFPTTAKYANRRRYTMVDTATPTVMLFNVWMDHLADGHSTTRLRSPRGMAPLAAVTPLTSRG